MTDFVWPTSMQHSFTANQPLSALLPSFPLHHHPHRHHHHEPHRYQLQLHRARPCPGSPLAAFLTQTLQPAHTPIKPIEPRVEGSSGGDPATPVSPLGLEPLPLEMPADAANSLRPSGHDVPAIDPRRSTAVPPSQLSYAPSRAATALPMGVAGMQFGRDRGDARRGSRRPSRPDVAANASQPAAADAPPRRKSSAGPAIAPALQIPRTINNSKGSLAEFAARITCLFWFESSALLRGVEEGQGTAVPAMRLVPEAVPTTGFRKWVTTILSTTQVTQNVILLALMFIYRLKNTNPTVKGRPGSEFRLLTVALMLGNKFLDDNTYTNKTWAEVSGISVQEIHVMEVEFLSNMRYSLFVSEAQWLDWHTTLGRFWDYFEHASAAPASQPEAPRRPSGPSTPIPNTLSPLPTPPASTHASPPYGAGQYMPTPLAFAHPLSAPPQLATPSLAALAAAPEIDLRPGTRKRSRDEGIGHEHEPAAKRPARPNPAPPSAGALANISRLLTPGSALPTARSVQDYAAMPSARLPQLGGHALPAVYPTPAPALQPQVNLAPLMAAQLQPVRPSISPYGDASRRQSAYPVTSVASPAASTPYSMPPTSSSMSPSYILTHRSSPYRPVREVSTLLVPPQSGITPTAPLQPPPNHMHYQPLAKARSEYRTGVVPYLPHDAWSYTRPHLPYMAVPQPSHGR